MAACRATGQRYWQWVLFFLIYRAVVWIVARLSTPCLHNVLLSF